MRRIDVILEDDPTGGLAAQARHRLAAQDEDRQNLLDLADRQGTSLSSQRAARAAAARRIAGLRNRAAPDGTARVPQ